ncbi:hypothetical protein B0G52_10841 [Cohnella sp. SGD-V74]|nr:hypothetical protein B0G52_10841 [Cohnella sp. SGD-V74]
MMPISHSCSFLRGGQAEEFAFSGVYGGRFNPWKRSTLQRSYTDYRPAARRRSRLRSTLYNQGFRMPMSIVRTAGGRGRRLESGQKGGLRAVIGNRVGRLNHFTKGCNVLTADFIVKMQSLSVVHGSKIFGHFADEQYPYFSYSLNIFILSRPVSTVSLRRVPVARPSDLHLQH